MRVSLFALGTRGDAEPAFALAYAMQQRGHQVAVGVAEDLVALGRNVGVDARPLRVNAREFLYSEEGRRLLAAGKDWQFLAHMAGKSREIADKLHADMIDIATGADMIMCSMLLEDEAVSLAEWLGVPFIGLSYFPFRRTTVLPSPYAPQRRLPRSLNWLTHVVFEQARWRSLSSHSNLLRRRIGLNPVSQPAGKRLARMGALEIQAYSRFVLPELSGWSSRLPLVGYLRLAPEQRDMLANEKLDVDLATWLDTGDVPVFFGLGSAPVLDVSGTVRMIRETCAALGVRALVSAGWNPMESFTDDEMYFVDDVNHDEVLPHCRVAVHHGGAGTTAASLRAGTPTVVCAVTWDMPFWGATVARLGVGNTFPFADLTAARLTAAIAPLLSDEVRRRSARLAGRLRTEDGPGNAAELIDQSM